METNKFFNGYLFQPKEPEPELVQQDTVLAVSEDWAENLVYNITVALDAYEKKIDCQQ